MTRVAAGFARWDGDWGRGLRLGLGPGSSPVVDQTMCPHGRRVQAQCLDGWVMCNAMCHLLGYEAVVCQHSLGRHVADGSVEARLLGLHKQHLRTRTNRETLRPGCSPLCTLCPDGDSTSVVTTDAPHCGPVVVGLRPWLVRAMANRGTAAACHGAAAMSDGYPCTASNDPAKPLIARLKECRNNFH